MQNKMSDLNNHLFAQIERLNEEKISSEEIEKEAKRTDALVAIADRIIDNAKLCLDAAKLVAQNGNGDIENGFARSQAKQGSDTPQQRRRLTPAIVDEAGDQILPQDLNMPRTFDRAILFPTRHAFLG